MNNRLQTILETVEQILSEARRKKGRQPGRKIYRTDEGKPAGRSESKSRAISERDKQQGYGAGFILDPQKMNQRSRDAAAIFGVAQEI